MSAGTLTLTNNSAAVTGSGTAFTTELAAGDFIVVTVGGIPYTLPVKTVNSNTSLTLVSNYTGPTQSGAAWFAVPRVALNMVTAALVAQSAEALRGLNYDKQNWQSIFSGTGNVTVKLPDGTEFTGPAWNSFTTELNKKANSSDLGSAATKNVGTTSGNVMEVGAFGLGTEQPPNPASSDANNAVSTGIYYANGGNAVNYFSGYTALLTLSRLPTNKSQIQVNASGTIGARAYGGSWSAWVTHYNTLNTTKASDGTLKAASPVARIVNSRTDNERRDVDEEGYTWCGCGTANAEAEGISISRLDVGVYVLTGAAGLASEGWQLLPPMDPGGMGELGIVEAEETESGGITIRLFRRKYMMTDDGEIVKTKGELIDVPASSWIDIRLDMPETSIWNQKNAAPQNLSEAPYQENQPDAQD